MILSSVQILETLVAFDTTSARSNLALIDWVANYLSGFGISSHLTKDTDGKKANLFATLGAEDVGGVCLHGHTDVVPVHGQPWETDPFRLTERAGRLFGRGTSDMKAWIACSLAAIARLQAGRLLTPIHLALGYDEEVGCLGAPRLLDSFGKAVPKPRFAFVGEPSMMAPISAQLPGPAGMQPSGPTISVGQMRSGQARNVIPREAYLHWELRFRAGDDPDQLMSAAAERVGDALRKRFGSRFIDLTLTTREVSRVPAFDAADDDSAVQLAQQLGACGPVRAVPYGAEAGQYAAAGVSTVICGPGSIEQAHQPNEFIAVSQVEACDRFLANLGAWAKETPLARGV